MRVSVNNVDSNIQQPTFSNLMAYLYQCWSCMSFIFCTLRHFPILYRLPSLGLVHHVLKHLHDTSTCQIQDATTRGITSVLYPWQHIDTAYIYHSILLPICSRPSALFLVHIDSSAYYSLPRHSCSCRPQHQIY